MRLYDEWRTILRRAWSIRLILLAGVLTGAEAVIQFTGAEWLPGPGWLRLAVIFGVMAAAFVARLVAQKGV